MSDEQENVQGSIDQALEAEEEEFCVPEETIPEGFDPTIHCHNRDHFGRWCKCGDDSSFGFIFSMGEALCKMYDLPKPHKCKQHFTDWLYAIQDKDFKSELLSDLAKLVRQDNEKKRQSHLEFLRLARLEALPKGAEESFSAEVAKMKAKLRPSKPRAILINGMVVKLFPRKKARKPQTTKSGSLTSSSFSNIGSQVRLPMVTGDPMFTPEESREWSQEFYFFIKPIREKVYELNDEEFFNSLEPLRLELFDLLKLPKKECLSQVDGVKAKLTTLGKEVDSQLEKRKLTNPQVDTRQLEIDLGLLVPPSVPL